MLQKGQRIKHAKYGLGTVIDTGRIQATQEDLNHTTFDFDSHGVKKFITSLMTVELSDAPLRKTRRRKRA